MSTHDGKKKKVEFIPARLLPPDDPFFHPSEDAREAPGKARRRGRLVYRLVTIMRKQSGDLPLKKLDEESSAAIGKLTVTLKDALRRLLEDNFPEKKHPGISAAMEGWLANATPEALAEWLADVDCRKRTEHEHKPELVEEELKPELEKHFPLPGDIYDWATRRAPRLCLTLFAIPLAQAAKTPEGKPARWLYMLAGPWLWERAEKEAERIAAENKARPLAPRTVRTKSGSIHAQLPKMTAGISWAFGGQGIILPEGYKAAPNMAALVPPGYALLKDSDLKKPKHYQATLPLLMDDEEAPPMVLSVAGASREVFDAAAGWLAVYVMAATCDQPEYLIDTHIEALTRAIYPEAPRLRPEHYENTAAGLCLMRNARVLWPNGYADAIFYVPRFPWKIPEKEHLTVPLKVGMDPFYLRRTMPDIVAATGIRSMAGQFVFNLTGAMALNKKKPGLLRQYLRVAATGNAIYAQRSGKPAPEQVPEINVERWAVLTNYLPSTASRYMLGKEPRPVGRVAKSKAIKRMLKDMGELEGLKLLKLDLSKDHKTVRLMLSDADLEAWAAFRAGKAALAEDSVPGSPG